eukprot:4153779-Karenia_brevis.AAC.1
MHSRRIGSEATASCMHLHKLVCFRVAQSPMCGIGMGSRDCATHINSCQRACVQQIYWDVVT